MKPRARAPNFGSSAAELRAGARRVLEGQGSATPAVIVTTPEALAALVRSAVSEVMNDVRQDPAPLLLDRTSAARALGIGTSSIDRFRKAGMPCVWVGEAPRFIVDECLAWLREHRRVQEDPECPPALAAACLRAAGAAAVAAPGAAAIPADALPDEPA